MTRFLLATDSVHTTAAGCDYLSDRIEDGDAVIALAVLEGTGGVDERDAADALNVATVRLPGVAETERREGDPVTYESEVVIDAAGALSLLQDKVDFEGTTASTRSSSSRGTPGRSVRRSGGLLGVLTAPSSSHTRPDTAPDPRPKIDTTRAAILLPAASESRYMFGGGGMDPAKMQQTMEQMGIDMDEFDAERVTIDLADGDRLVFEGPDVTKMEARGQSTYMVVGDPDRHEDASEPPELDEADSQADAGPEIPQDDVDLVATRTGASAEDAREALEAEDGDLAAAIARLE